MPAAKSDPTADFFAKLATRGREPLLAKAVGSARFNIVDGKRTESWLLTIDKGELLVSRRKTTADCVVRSGKTTFERAAAGKLNLMAAVLRGEVEIQGDLRLLVLLQRLFPRPSRRKTRKR
jgi:putative sterol carrier protein